VGSLRVITDTTGTVVKQITYDSFGIIITDTLTTMEVPFGFAGGLHDRDTGLVRFGFRDYDPSIGRWTAKDPIDFAGGDVNLFGYTGNDPINYTDPIGLIWYNRKAPDTVPVKGDTKNAIECVEKCLKAEKLHDNKGLLLTGGAETTGHSAGSLHYSGKACDIAGKKFHSFTDDQVFTCARECNFTHGQYEDKAGENADHWHLQIGEGLNVPKLPPAKK
jgi:RHS repeat-associated protein